MKIHIKIYGKFHKIEQAWLRRKIIPNMIKEIPPVLLPDIVISFYARTPKDPTVDASIDGMDGLRRFKEYICELTCKESNYWLMVLVSPLYHKELINNVIDYLKSTRVTASKTVIDLAQLIGVNANTVADWCSGHRLIGKRSLKKIYALMSTPVSEIFN